MKTLDARGLSCPEPVLMLRAALTDKPASCAITVDNPAARGNCERFARHAGYGVETSALEGGWTLTLRR